MNFESMDLDQLAIYLNRDSRELDKLAKRGHLPGQKIGGAWRFAQAEINLWLETQIPSYTDPELLALERHARPLLAQCLGESTIGWPLVASTRASVMKGLVQLAEQSWQVYDPDVLLAEIRERETLGSTALENGAAIPHPRRRAMPSTVLGESVVSLGFVPRGIPFGAPGGAMTDLFFLVACTDHATHLQILTRLSRLFLRPDFLPSLREAESAIDAYRLIEAAEAEILGLP